MPRFKNLEKNRFEGFYDKIDQFWRRSKKGRIVDPKWTFMVKIYWIMIEALYFSPKTPMLCKISAKILRFWVSKDAPSNKMWLHQVKVKFATNFYVNIDQKSTNSHAGMLSRWKNLKMTLMESKNSFYWAIIDVHWV